MVKILSLRILLWILNAFRFLRGKNVKWVVQVSGKSTVLDELCEVLDDENLKIESLNGSYFLTSSGFVNLTSPEIVSGAAQNLLE